MEHSCTGAIPEGEWISHSLSGMYMADQEADYMMIQLLGNCPTISDVAIPDAFLPRHEESTSMDIPANYESRDYSLESTNFNIYGISQGTNLFPTSSNQFCNFSDSYSTKNVESNDNSMSTGFCAGEAKNTTSSYIIEGEGDQCLNRENIDGNVEESGRNQREESARRHEKSNTSSKINSLKRPKISENDQMNKRSRKSNKSCNNEEDSNHMASQLQLNGGMSPNNEAATLNLNGKSRLTRGSATDAQSLYARRRREKINQRLRVLQNLVPNGTKVDISTMLEEAVNYVKFLQLQIKMLSSDDLWMYSPVCYNGMLFGHDHHVC